MNGSLAGKKIWILIGEPWNFHQFVDPKKCIGEVTSVIKGAPDDWITVKWEFEWESKRYLFGQISARHVGHENLIERLLNNEAVACNMIFFEDKSELGSQLARLGGEELNTIDKNYPNLTQKLGLIGSVQRVTNAPAPWERD